MFALAMLACAGSSSGDKDGRRALPPVDTDTGDTVEPAPAATITDVEVTCGGPLVATARTAGRSDRGRLFIATANRYEGYTEVGENHPMIVVDEDPNGLWSDLAATLTFGGYVPGVETRFPCDYVADGRLTYVVRIYDEPGNLQDCVVWGLDSAGLLAGELDIVEPIEDPEELAGCSVR